MPRPYFCHWLKEQRETRELSYEECVGRINRAFGTNYNGESTFRQWESRENEDTPRDRCRKVAHALQMPLNDVFTAAGLLPDDEPPVPVSPLVATLYSALDADHRELADAIIATLHSQMMRRKS